MTFNSTHGSVSRARAQHAFAAAVLLLAAIPTTLPAQAGGGSVAAPTNVWAAQNSPRALTLVWDSVPGASGFRLYRGSGESATVFARPSANSRSWVVPVTNAMLSTAQQFAIEALDASGKPSPRVSFNSATPVPVNTVAGGPMPAPAAVTATLSGPGEVTVSWDAVPGATAYVIGRGVQPWGFRVACGLCSTRTTFVDRFAAGDTAKRQYSVAAVTPRGAGRATRSNEIKPSGGGGIVAGGTGTGGTGTGGTGTGGTGTGGTGTGGTGTGGTGTGGTGTGGTGTGGTGGTGTVDSTAGSGGSTTATTPPPPPTSVVARKSAFPATGAELTWQGGTGVESFRISRMLCSRTAQQVATVPAGAIGTSRPWLDTIPAAAIRANCSADFFGMYTVGVMYTVVAANAAGSSPPAPSSQVSFKIASTSLDAMGTTATASTLASPTPLSATVNGATSVALNWQSSAGAASYLLYRSVCGKPAEVAKTVLMVAGSPNVTDADNVPWTTFNTACMVGTTSAPVVYSVAAKGSDGTTSAPARFPVVTLTLPQKVYGTAAPTAVTGAQASFSSGKVFLKWNGQVAATSYRIERALGVKGSWQYLAMVEGSQWYYTDATTGLSTMNPFYRIIATNPNGSAPAVVFTWP